MNDKKLCDSCGEAEGVEFIIDPNYHEELTPDWWVCKDCKLFIRQAKLEAIKLLMEHTHSSNYENVEAKR